MNSAQVQHLSEDCGAVEWTSPAMVAADSSDQAVARYTSVGTGEGAVFILGNDVRDLSIPMVPEGPFVAWDGAGKNIGRPSGRYSYVYPRALVDETGRLHVLWGEPPEGPGELPNTDWPPRRITSVWTAAYTPSEGWSSARQLYSGGDIAWHSATVADPATTGSSELSVTVGPGFSASSQTVLIFRYIGGAWTSTAVDLDGSISDVAYVSYVSANAHAYLAFIGSDTNPMRGGNSVWVAESPDGGQSWRTPRLVSAVGTTPAFELQALRTANSLRLLWLQSVTAERRIDRPTTVRQRISIDGANTWGEPADVGVPGWHRQLRAAIDRCGRTHIVVDDWSGGPDQSQLTYAVWLSAWSAPQTLFPDYRTYDPDLRIARSGSLVLSFMGRAITASATSQFETLKATSQSLP